MKLCSNKYFRSDFTCSVIHNEMTGGRGVGGIKEGRKKEKKKKFLHVVVVSFSDHFRSKSEILGQFFTGIVDLTLFLLKSFDILIQMLINN